ncbi:MAG: glycerophosphodiester phosphodiesterase family protein [Acutalibacteraceae bacterium]
MLNIAYSSFGKIAYFPNTMEVFFTAKKFGFKIVKADIRVSSDGEFILCHDKGFKLIPPDYNIISKASDTSEEKHSVDINCTSYDDLKSYMYDTLNTLGYYSKIANIDDFLQICNELDMIPYITLREEFASNYIYDGENTQYFGAPQGQKVGEYLIQNYLKS